ncbi:major capsid protein [Microviridae sp.]|nr:major capsid protein [Microviridae sp.]
MGCRPGRGQHERGARELWNGHVDLPLDHGATGGSRRGVLVPPNPTGPPRFGGGGHSERKQMPKSRRPSTTGTQHSFAKVPAAQIQRSAFNRSSGHKTTMNSGDLVPIFWDEALPGDTFSMRATVFGRCATLLKPIMDNVYVELFFFSVPCRLGWDNWKKFRGEQANPGDSVDYLVPQVTAPTGGWTELSIGDYMGIPTKVDPLPVNALYFRAINLIYNEWFRDQNLQDSMPVPMGDGPDDPSNYKVLKRGKRKDYLTGALPWPQKGDAVDMPLGQSAPVVPGPNPVPEWDINGTEANIQSDMVNSVPHVIWDVSNMDEGVSAKWGADPGLEADLTQAPAATVNDLRQAFQLQKMLERDARSGTRYTETIRAHFRVDSPDARQQRPLYLGGGSFPLNVRQVETTAQINTKTGELAAYGTFGQTGRQGHHSFTEHEIIIGFASIRADLNYQQGLDRAMSRRTKYDYYWPSLAHLGEQAILSKEIYADGTAADEDVFGYQERFGEYRYKQSRITGQFRSNADTPLDVWHLAQDFADRPTLSDLFIEENPPMTRVIATPTEPEFLVDAFFQLRCARPMPTFSVPGLIDHF